MKAFVDQNCSPIVLSFTLQSPNWCYRTCVTGCYMLLVEVWSSRIIEPEGWLSMGLPWIMPCFYGNSTFNLTSNSHPQTKQFCFLPVWFTHPTSCRNMETIFWFQRASLGCGIHPLVPEHIHEYSNDLTIVKWDKNNDEERVLRFYIKDPLHKTSIW